VIGVSAQLGVGDYEAIYSGALADKPQFFGTALAETVSAADEGGGWNGDRSNSFTSTRPWLVRGGRANNAGAQELHAGPFASHSYTGAVYYYFGYGRTILSGY
jgi:hypothetical protein